MQEIVSFCDWHVEREGARVLGEGFRIGIAGTWKRLDLCSECMKELLGPLEVVLQAHGEAVADAAPELLRTPQRRSPIYSDEAYARRIAAMSTPRQCLWCPEVVPDGYAKLKAHIARHGFSDFDQAYGSTCPICLQKGLSRLSGHVGRAHMVKLAEAFEWAFYGGNAAARAVAEARRNDGRSIGTPARIEGAVERVALAREQWVAAHGEP